MVKRRVPALCSLEQWEIYKLDPAYECFVHAAPKLSTISKADVNGNTTNVNDNTFSIPDELRATPPPKQKRQAPSPSSSNKKMPKDSRKRFRTTIEILSSSSDDDGHDAEHPINLANSEEEDEVEEIIVDFTPPKRPMGPHGFGFASLHRNGPFASMRERQRRHQEMEERRKQRRERLTSRTRPTFKTEPSSHGINIPDSEFASQAFGYSSAFFPDPTGAKKRKGTQTVLLLRIVYWLINQQHPQALHLRPPRPPFSPSVQKMTLSSLRGNRRNVVVRVHLVQLSKSFTRN